LPAVVPLSHLWERVPRRGGRGAFDFAVVFVAAVVFAVAFPLFGFPSVAKRERKLLILRLTVFGFYVKFSGFGCPLSRPSGTLSHKWERGLKKLSRKERRFKTLRMIQPGNHHHV